MASSDVDQKYLGRIAQFIEETNPDLADALYQVLGLSVVLSRKLYRARKLRRLDTTRDTRSLQLYHHIIWLSKEGLAILERWVLPYTQNGQEGPETQVIASKLRASFLHIFCLFHNDPPVTLAGNHIPTPGTEPAGAESGYESMTPQKTTPPKRNSKGKQPSLRDPINSVTSDASFLTNPYAGLPPGESPPLGYAPVGAPPGLSTQPIHHPSAFLIPSLNFIPYANNYFSAAIASATALLPGAHPLRLSTNIEYAAFLWDCVHDHSGARYLAKQAIRQLRDREDEEVSDESFEDAAEMVTVLGRIMKRKSFETTPRTQYDEAAMSAQTPALSQFTVQQPAATRTQQQQYISATTRKPVPQPANSINAVTPTRQISTRQRAQSNASYHSPKYVRDTRRDSLNQNPPSVEGGPVGGIAATPPRRRESVKSSSTSHRRNQSLQEPVAQRSQRSSVSSRRRQEPETPPRPPPKDTGYSPSSRGSLSGPKTISKAKYAPYPTSPTARRGSSASRKVEFANNITTPTHTNGNGIRHDTPTAPYTNGNGVHTNGHYSNAASDMRGRGER